MGMRHPAAYMKFGAELLLEITDVAYGGDGIARHDGRVVFVPFTIPGEKIRVRITDVRRGWARAVVRQILEPSPDRVTPPCPYFMRCGGCAYQHIAYERQLALKAHQVSETLRRIGKIPSPPVEPTRSSPLEYHYRNRITVHVHPPTIGFHGVKSERIVDVDKCLLAEEAVQQALTHLRSKKYLHPGPATLRANRQHAGFRQVNDGAAKILASVVIEMAETGASCVDAYCGTGFFARKLASNFQRILGIDWDERAITAAREDAQSQEDYRVGDVEKLLPQTLEELPKSTVLLDPPSQGLSPAVIETLRNIQPPRLIYVSCDPATLARDIAKLSPAYQLVRAVPVDMFPQTASIETACLLHRFPA